jgi:hypothetical protein
MIALRAIVVATFLVVLVPVATADPPAAAQEGGCSGDQQVIDCIIGAPVPGSTGPLTGGENRQGQGTGRRIPMISSFGLGGNRAGCGGSTITGTDANRQRDRLNDAPSTGVTNVCGGAPEAGVDPTRVQIVPEAADAPAPPTPDAVAVDLLAEAETQMRAPQVVADPPVGTPSIISLPVFVQVTNWVDGIEESDCVLGVCVTLTAEPTLTFDPGEPGSSPIVCEPPGTRFDPNGADPEVQAAAAGACAHAYQNRTGAEGRPDVWPGEVTVSWDVSWTAGEASGDFPAQDLSTSLPREVDEVQTVVRDGAGS